MSWVHIFSWLDLLGACLGMFNTAYLQGRSVHYSVTPVYSRALADLFLCILLASI